MQIGNGRLMGDCLGNFTHYSKNKGQSTVDLALISDTLYPEIDDLKVLPQETYSDHCKIILTISNMKEIKTEERKAYEWNKLKPAFKWGENSQIKYKDALETPEIMNMISSCRTYIQENKIEEAGKLLQDLLIRAAKLSLEEKKAFSPSSKKRTTKKSKKWFDVECSKLKKQSNRAARKKNQDPSNTLLREDHRKKLKEFNTACKDKKQKFWIKETYNLNKLLGSNDFWKKWKQFGEDTKTQKEHPGSKEGEKWEYFFRDLYKAKNGECQARKIEHPISEALNCRVEMKELKNTILKLKDDKAVGMDRIANEFIKAANDKVLQLLLDIINKNVETGRSCTNWCVGIISVIHKEGPLDDPNNYRGICVVNALLKVLCTILNERLITFCTENKLINKAQIGFWKNCRTSDHLATLKTVSNKYITDGRTKKLYACFVDFQKAFDSVWHEAMFRKLGKKGIN